jgi:hypothetical protein
MMRRVPELHLSRVPLSARIEWVHEFVCSRPLCESPTIRIREVDPVRARAAARAAGVVNMGRGRDLCATCALAATQTSARPNPLGVGGGNPHGMLDGAGAPQRRRRACQGGVPA